MCVSVAYAKGAKANDVGPTGNCPASHPVVIPQVMYEVMWDVSLSRSRNDSTCVANSIPIVDPSLQRPSHLA
jgi:hypothetical protein